MTITVVVPTYKRHEHLSRCLQSLENQQRPADCILIVVARQDELSRTLAKDLQKRSPGVVILDAPPGGVRTALNLALEKCTTDIVVLTDDDSEAYPSWLLRIEEHFTNDPLLGGVGGRDELQYENRPELSNPPPTDQIGNLDFLGKLNGNHHHPPISDLLEVDSLKGVNMALRRIALGEVRIDDALRGDFAQVGWELILSFNLRSRGWKLLFDKNLPIRHWVGERVPEDSRSVSNFAQGANAVHNTTYALVCYGPIFRSVLASMREILIGNKVEPGFLSISFLLMTGEVGAWSRFRRQLPARLRGLASGLIGWARNPRRLYFNWPTLGVGRSMPQHEI